MFIFEQTLNCFAEICCFGDRLFYTDWWNASSFLQFYSRFNKVVYDFFKLYIYIPLVEKYGFSKSRAFSASVAVSAILHEFILCVTLKAFNPLIFIVFMI
jgi:diacylglycerol O-acyltransferase-1